jgi:hypothetical protein
MHHYDRCWRSRSERATGKIPSLGVSRCNPCQTCCPERGGEGGGWRGRVNGRECRGNDPPATRDE